MKNPLELFSVVRDQTFGLSNHLAVTDYENGLEPLKIHHPKFSRLGAVIINKNKVPATANIPVRDLELLLKRGAFALNKEFELEIAPKETLSSGYTVLITSGKHKNKTPATVLLENGEAGMSDLEQQYKWLKDNLAKYPNNKVQMDAIQDAVLLARAGKLKNKGNSNTFIIYNPGVRHLERRKREDGKVFIYEIKMYWRFGNKYPFVVEIENYYAPLSTSSNGLKTVIVSKRDSVVKNVMYLSANEYANMEHLIRVNLDNFEKNCYKELAEVSIKEDMNNRAQAKKVINM